MQLNLPVVIFGKPPGQATTPQGIDKLARHPQIDEQACKAIAQIASGFSWRGDVSKQSHSSCFGLWPLDDTGQRMLILRLLDVGHDDQNRPHSLRVEAALVECEEALADLVALLNRSAWPEDPVEIAAEPMVTLKSVEPSDGLRNLAAELDRQKRPSTMVVGDPSTFRTSAFKLVFDCRRNQVVSSPEKSPDPPSPQPRPRNSKRIVTGLLWLLSGILIAGIPLFLWNENLKSEINTLSQKLTDTRELHRKLQEGFELIQENREKTDEELEAWRTVGNTFNNPAPEKLRSYIASLKEGEIRRFAQENESLKGQLNKSQDELMKKDEKLKQLIKQLQGILEPNSTQR